MNKKELRKRLLELRGALSPKERYDKSICIAQQVIELACFKKCNKILLYMPVRGEVETQEIHVEAQRLGKKIYYPKVNGQQMEFYLTNETTKFEMSAYGIKEPKPESTASFKLDEEDEILAIIPGVAFDTGGNRIGYGGGYYDKYLRWMECMGTREKISRVAVAYACQIVDAGLIENEAHDVRVDYIVTEETNEHISN